MESSTFTLSSILLELENPILIGGKALEHYGIRKSHDYDFIVSEKDFSKLTKKFKVFDDFPKATPGIKLFNPKTDFEIDLFVEMFGYKHRDLIKNCKKKGKYYIADIKDLLLLKCKTLTVSLPNRKRNITIKDITNIAKVL
jgi:hypothetical protein